MELTSSSKIQDRTYFVYSTEKYLSIFLNSIPIISIERESGKRSIPDKPPSEEEVTEYTFAAIYGAIESDGKEFLVCVSDYVYSCSIFGFNIYSVKEVRLLPMDPSRQEWDSMARSRLKDFLSSGFYFSLDYDLHCRTGTKSGKRLDSHFCWNAKAMRKLVGSWVEKVESLPVFVQGFVGWYGAEDLKVALISRRSFLRSGPRFKHRGVDAFGSAANFVETEILVTVGGRTVSLLQIRGSLPFFWEQGGVTEEPKVRQVSKSEVQAFIRHYDHLMAYYQVEKLVIANLLSTKPSEQILSKQLSEIIEKSQKDVTVFSINLNELVNSNQQDLKKKVSELAKFFPLIASEIHQKESAFTLDNSQKCLIRTNCLDCVDRTNLFQMMLFEEWMSHDFPNQLNSHCKELRKLWTSQAHNLSEIYTGASAVLDSEALSRPSFFSKLSSKINSFSRLISKNFDDDLKFEAGKLAVCENYFPHRPPWLSKDPSFFSSFLVCMFKEKTITEKNRSSVFNELKKKMSQSEKLVFFIFKKSKSSRFQMEDIISEVAMETKLRPKKIWRAGPYQIIIFSSDSPISSINMIDSSLGSLFEMVVGGTDLAFLITFFKEKSDAPKIFTLFEKEDSKKIIARPHDLLLVAGQIPNSALDTNGPFQKVMSVETQLKFNLIAMQPESSEAKIVRDYCVHEREGNIIAKFDVVFFDSCC